jgi:SAM-dependent methyltransferase
MKLIESDLFLTPEELTKKEHSNLMKFEEVAKKRLLASPINKDVLDEGLKSNGAQKFTFYNGSPILFPNVIIDHLLNKELPLEYFSNSYLQYYLLSQIKGKSEINAPSNSLPANKHFYRMKEFCREIGQGNLLDVGCDRPSLSHLFYPSGINYIGLDPSFSNDEFKVLGMAEFLPFTDNTFDFVSFNTSLDHILDYHTALDEAFRVLKKGASLILASYVWKDKATLLSDNVHFHHFREFELFGALESSFSIESIKRYQDPKNKDHRYGIYILAKKK